MTSLVSRTIVIGVFIVFAGVYFLYLTASPLLQPDVPPVAALLRDRSATTTTTTTTTTTATTSTTTTASTATAAARHLSSPAPHQIFPELRYLDDMKKFKVNYLPELRNPCWISGRGLRGGSASVAPQAQAVANRTATPDSDAADSTRRVSPKHVQPHNSRLRCLPYFFLIGQPKCGTTDIFQRIQYHPHVVAPGMKGPHWWTRSRLGPPYASRIIYFDEYLDLFNNISSQITRSMLKEETQTEGVASNQERGLQALDSSSENDQNLSMLQEGQLVRKGLRSKDYRLFITGDASPSTMWDSSPTMQLLQGRIQGKGLRGSKLRNELLRDRGLTMKEFVDSGRTILTTADVLHHYLPDSKIIVVLREPVSRLFSSYLFFTTKYQPSAEDFHERVEMTLDLWNQCVLHDSQRNCAYNKTLQQTMGVRLHNSLYSIFLRDWLQVFPKEQVFVLRLEDYRRDLTGTLAKIYHHLGLRTLTPEEELTVVSAPVKNRSKKKNDVGHMHNDTKTLLQRFYEPFNRELAYLLNDLGFTWEDVYSTW